jgi:succinyl-CoA synthetase alpha subunit
MSILVDRDTRLLVQGIAGPEGTFYVEHALAGGTHVVAGVTVGQGGTWVAGVPVFDTVGEATQATDANASILYVPAKEATEAILESVDAGLGLVVCATSGVPVWDMVQVKAYVKDKPVCLIGPNSPGVFAPGQCLAGIVSEEVLKPGSVGVVSRSGSLTYEVTALLTRNGFGQSTVVGIGSDVIVGTGFAEILAMFEDDPLTEQVVIVGEIGGQEEEMAAAYVRDHVTKPVVACVAGQTAPPGRRMGHAGAIIEGYANTAQLKMDALKRSGVRVAGSIGEISHLLERENGGQVV